MLEQKELLLVSVRARTSSSLSWVEVNLVGRAKLFLLAPELKAGFLEVCLARPHAFGGQRGWMSTRSAISPLSSVRSAVMAL